MTAISNKPSQSGSDDWQSQWTEREASRAGFSHSEFRTAFVHARSTAEHHQRVGTPRHKWEPTQDHNQALSEPPLTDGEQEMLDCLEHDVDHNIDVAQSHGDDAATTLAELTALDEPLITPETGVPYSIHDAVDAVENILSPKIEQDEARGKNHHRRVPTALAILGRWAPAIEILGFFAFVAYYLDVPLLQPWSDWFGWTFAVTVVTVSILGQTWLVHHAATNHNHARETESDGNRHEADKARTKRTWFLIAGAIVAGGITSGMILRGLAALGPDASRSTITVLTFLAATAGLLMPTLAYLATALDGSRISRERDTLVADLDEHLSTHRENIQRVQDDLTAMATIREEITNKMLPTICTSVQEIVDGVYRPHGLIRLLIGSLEADPPSRTPMTITVDGDGTIHGRIGTSLPGAQDIDLRPLFDRARRLAQIDHVRTDLANKLRILPQHPWGKIRS